MVPGTALVCEMVPVAPLRVRVESDWIVIEFPVADDRTTPLLLSVPVPLRFRVMALSVETVTPVLTDMAALTTVALTEPPLRFRVEVPTPDCENTSAWPAVGVIAIAPPLVANVADDPVGDVMVSGFVPPPESIVIEPAVNEAPAAAVICGVLINNAPPPLTVVATPAAASTEPPVAVDKSLTVPDAPGLKLYAELRLSTLAPPAEAVIVEAPPPVAEIVTGVPASVSVPVLCIAMAAAAPEEVIVPLLVKVVLLTLNVNELFPDRTTPELIVVALLNALPAVVTGPTKLKVAVPAPAVFEKARALEEKRGCRTWMLPPAPVETVA